MPNQFDPRQWVRAHEGFRDDVYLDSLGKPTVGVGHLITESSPYYGAQVGDYISTTQLEEQYAKDYDHHAELAAKNFKNFEQHPPHVQEALINMTFQMGNKPSKWKNFNKALQEGIETGNYQDAAYHASDSKWFRDQTPKRARSVLDRLAYGDQSTYAYNRPEEFSELPDYAMPAEQFRAARGYEEGVPEVPHIPVDQIEKTEGRSVPTREEIATLIKVLDAHPAYGGHLGETWHLNTYDKRNPFGGAGLIYGYQGHSGKTGNRIIGVGIGPSHQKSSKDAADWANTIYHEYGHLAAGTDKHRKKWSDTVKQMLPPPGTANWRGPDRLKGEHYEGDGHDHGPEDFLPEGFADGWWQDAKDTARGAKRGYQVYKAIDDYDTWARETPFVPAIYKWDEPTSWSTIREYAPDALKAAKYVGKAERKLEDWADTAGGYVDTAKGWLGFADGIDWSRFSPEELEYFKTLPAEEQARMLGVAKAETALAVPPVAAEIPAWMVEPVQQENVVDKAQEDYTEAAADRHAKYREALGYAGGEWNVGLSEGLYKEIESMKLTNPEAGPSDTVPAMLTPGEAVIPASVAMDEDYKPLIKEMVEEGRDRNNAAEAIGIPVNHPAVPGLADGGALDSKISKIYNEGYTAPGQAYAIAKSKGYAGGRPEISPSTKDKAGKVPGWVLDFIPVVGEAKGAKQAYDAYKAGDYGTAALEAGGTLLGAVPGGDLVKGAAALAGAGYLGAKGVKAFNKAMKADYNPKHIWGDYAGWADDVSKKFDEAADAAGDYYDPEYARLVQEGRIPTPNIYQKAPSKGGKGFEEGTTMIPKPMGAPPKYNIEEPDHSRFDQAEMGQGTSMMMTNAKHKQAIANKEGAQAQKMDHMKQTDMYKLQMDAMKADQKMAQKMAEKSMDMNTKMMEADVDSEVARRKQEALTASMSGYGLTVPPVAEPPQGSFGPGVDQALEAIGTAEDLQGFSPVTGYADGATTGELDQSSLEDINALIPQPAVPLSEASTIPFREGEIPVATPTGTATEPGEVPPVEGVDPLALYQAGAVFGNEDLMEQSGLERYNPRTGKYEATAAGRHLDKKEPSAQGQLDAMKVNPRQTNQAIAAAAEETFNDPTATPEQKVEASKTIDLAMQAGEEQAAAVAKTAASQLGVGADSDEDAAMTDENGNPIMKYTPEQEEELKAWAAEPYGKGGVVTDSQGNEVVIAGGERSKAARQAELASGDEKRGWLDAVGGFFKNALGDLTDPNSLATAAIVYGANRLMGFDNDTAGREALKFHQASVQQRHATQAAATQRVQNLQDFATQEAIKAGAKGPAAAQKLQQQNWEKGRSFAEKSAKEALDTYGSQVVDAGRGTTRKERLITATSSQIGGQYEKFMKDAGIQDFNAPGNTRALDSALRAAVRHKQATGEDVTDITPFLWQQYLPESTEMSNIFATPKGGSVSGKRITELNNMIKSTWTEGDLATGTPQAQLITNDLIILKRAYNQLRDSDPKKWQRYEAASGDDNGFMRFAREQMSLLK